jgi:hypothetical protein
MYGGWRMSTTAMGIARDRLAHLRLQCMAAACFPPTRMVSVHTKPFGVPVGHHFFMAPLFFIFICCV